MGLISLGNGRLESAYRLTDDERFFGGPSTLFSTFHEIICKGLRTSRRYAGFAVSFIDIIAHGS